MKIDPRERIELEHAQRICTANGYIHYRRFPSGRDAAICKLMYTWAIYADLTAWGYGDRWCFSSYAKALTALAEWDGADDTEPQGWHRHPDSGRRREDGDPARETVNF